jgi:radical SAM protein with 4Fe4S-binding SPASM domain
MKKKGEKFWMKFIDDVRNCVGMDRQTGPVCGIARNSIAVDANGYLYACQRYASFSDQEINLGNVWDGFDEKKLADCNNVKREEMFPDPKSGFECKTCPAFFSCRGGCNAMNFQCNGDRKMILANVCRFKRMWTQVALRVLSVTGELWNKRGGGQGCGVKK